MIKIIKPAIILITGFLLIQSSNGQEQKDFEAYLKQKFLSYTASVPREEIYLHSDRDEYVSGEDLWFNIYLIDRQNFKPSPHSRVVYFELLNAENRPVIQTRILIDKGFGPGMVVLPDTLSTGIYLIRAYTNWMKNFLPFNCYVKQIEVFNTLNTIELKKKFNARHIIRKSDDNTLLKEDLIRGIALNVNNSKPDILEIHVITDEKFRSENNNRFYVFIQTHGNINHVSSETMTKQETIVRVPKSDLIKGINQITLFNSRGEPVAEKYIFTSVKENTSPYVDAIDSCGVRNKITIEIDSGILASGALNPSNVSLSVVPVNTTGKSIGIDDYMVFGTEYGTLPWNVTEFRKRNQFHDFPADSILSDVKSNWIDWKVILSDEMPHFKYNMENEDHFLSGKLVTDDQKAVNSSELLFMCIPGKEASFQYAWTDNEGNFSFSIHIDEEIKDLIIMTADGAKNHKIVIESSFSDRYPETELSVDSSATTVPPHISKISVNNQVEKIFGTSAIGPPVKQILFPSTPSRFYGKPDIELILSDYISLPVMSEIFFELLKGVSLKKKQSGYEISISQHVGDKLYVTSPSLMIDGVIINDPSIIANLDPDIVERIDVIKDKYLIGKYFFPGIVNVITRSGDFSCISIPDYMFRLAYKVIDPVLSFVSPDYSLKEAKESRIPDYRNTLYWNPSVKPGKDGKFKIEFWSSDNKSEYEINIQGIAQDGKLFELKKIIKVK